ncbi:hypothetical protein E7X38_29110 [Streptomyces sp. Akac8]|nr:hypothetical protein E7X38_29110 [Streptomyces sp. Akac8]
MTSSAAPHVRRARLADEGGRGLLLVAQLTQKWGTRHTHHSKSIWCEQQVAASLPPRSAISSDATRLSEHDLLRPWLTQRWSS